MFKLRVLDPELLGVLGFEFIKLIMIELLKFSFEFRPELLDFSLWSELKDNERFGRKILRSELLEFKFKLVIIELEVFEMFELGVLNPELLKTKHL